jgi:hypothetical protein
VAVKLKQDKEEKTIKTKGYQRKRLTRLEDSGKELI